MEILAKTMANTTRFPANTRVSIRFQQLKKLKAASIGQRINTGLDLLLISMDWKQNSLRNWQSPHITRPSSQRGISWLQGSKKRRAGTNGSRVVLVPYWLSLKASMESHLLMSSRRKNTRKVMYILLL
jgi:hypothetical protein